MVKLELPLRDGAGIEPATLYSIRTRPTNWANHRVNLHLLCIRKLVVPVKGREMGVKRVAELCPLLTEISKVDWDLNPNCQLFDANSSTKNFVLVLPVA